MDERAQLGRWMVVEVLANNRRTYRWLVWSQQSGRLLGEIAWYGRWGQYVFKPDPNSAFNRECLNDLIEFLEAVRDVRTA